MTCFSLPQYRKPSPGFGVEHIVLTLCGCGMAISICLNLLLGILISLLSMYTFFMFIVFRNSIRGLNNIILYDINNLLCSIYSECSKNKQFILIKPLLIFSLAVYTCASSLVSIYYFSQELVEY